nr:DUF2232 domain-containing protein [Bacillus piscicola]
MLFLALFVPFLISILLWFMPLPFIIYTARYGIKSALVMGTVTLFLSFVVGGLVGLPNALLAGAGGILAGELIRRKKDAFLVLAGSSLAYISVLLLIYAASLLILNIDPLAALQDIMRQSTEQAESMLGALGQETAQNLEMWNEMIDQIGYLGPVLIVATAVSYAVISQWIAYAVLKRLRMDFEAFPPFREWNFPRAVLWYYLIVSVIFIIGVEEGSALYMVTWNLFPLLEVVMALQGFTVIFYFAYAKAWPKAVPVILLISGLFLPFVLLLARILGIIDLGFQLKKRLESYTK